MVSKARQPKEEEEKRKRPIDFLQILRERRNRRIVIKLEADQQGPGEGAGGGMLQGVGAELMEADPHLQAHLMIMKPQPDSDNEELEMILGKSSKKKKSVTNVKFWPKTADFP